MQCNETVTGVCSFRAVNDFMLFNIAVNIRRSDLTSAHVYSQDTSSINDNRAELIERSSDS